MRMQPEKKAHHVQKKNSLSHSITRHHIFMMRCMPVWDLNKVFRPRILRIIPCPCWLLAGLNAVLIQPTLYLLTLPLQTQEVARRTLFRRHDIFRSYNTVFFPNSVYCYSELENVEALRARLNDYRTKDSHQ